MKLDEENFSKKSAIINAVNEVYAEHGNGYDISIKVSFLVVVVYVTELDNGKFIGGEKFEVQLQSGDVRMITSMTKRLALKAFEKLGAL